MKERFHISAFSDWHTPPVPPLLSAIKDRKPDLVLYAGDSTSRFGILKHTTGDYDIEKLRDSVTPMFYASLPEVPAFVGTRRCANGSISFEWLPNSSEETLQQKMKKKSQEYPVVVFQSINEHESPSYLIIWDERSVPRYFEQLIEFTTYGVGGVIGNDCAYYTKTILTGPMIYDLHEKPLILDWLGVIGLEGAPLKDNAMVRSKETLYDEGEALLHLEDQWTSLEDSDIERVILVTHTPPKGILDFSVRYAKDHIGSQAVREFVDTHNVDLIICGHSHFCGGLYQKVGNTTVINAASQEDKDAEPIIVDVIFDRMGEIEVTGAMHQKITVQWRELIDLPNVGWKTLKRLVNMGITSIQMINEENRSLLRQLPGVSYWHIDRWFAFLQAKAEGIAYLTPHNDWNQVRTHDLLFYDIETDLEGNPWCIGVWDYESNEVRQFFNPKDEVAILSDFFQFLSTRKDALLVSFSGTRYDLRCLSKSANRHGIDVPLKLKSEIDLGILIGYHTVGLPYYNLKDLAQYLGYEWNSDMNGFQVGMAVTVYFRSGKEPDWDMFLKYNQDDVLATKFVLKRVLMFDERC